MISNPNTVYISDLDGTLLQSDARLSSPARAAIIELLANGVQFTIATARSITSTKEILGDIPLTLPVVCTNGGSIFDFHTIEPLHVEFLSAHLKGQLIGDIFMKADAAFISVHLDGREHVFHNEPSNGGMRWYIDDRAQAGDGRLERVADIRMAMEHAVTTITFMDTHHRIKAMRRFLVKKYGYSIKTNFFENKYSPGWYWLSVHSQNATKGYGLEQLRKLADLKDHRFVVFGDELNDLPMFEYADVSIAVENALPSVKRAADHVIGSNTSDAVIKFIQTAHKMA